MLQIYVYDDTGASFELDLYKEEPMKLTLSAEEINDIPRVNSAFSKAFRVPATQKNSRVFQWWYEVNTVDFDITKRVRADIYSDGVFYKSGHIRIQNAFVNQTTTQVDLEVVFFGETRDFGSQVGELTLPELTGLAQYSHELTTTYVQNSWTATDAPVRYILADKGYTYDDANNNAPLQNVIAFGGPQSWTNHFTQMNHPISLGQFTPMIQAKAIIDAIFDQTSYTYSADSFFNDNLFKQLYVDGIPFPSVTTVEDPATFRAESTGQSLSVFGGSDFVDFQNEINDPTNSYNPLTSFFFPPVAANYTMNTSVNLSLGRNLADPSPDYRVIIVQGGTILFDSGTISAPSGIGRYDVTVNLGGITPLVQYNGNVNTAVSVQVTITNTNGNNDIDADSVFQVTAVSAAAVSIPALMKYEIKSIDFLKSILTKFKLIMVPSADNEFEFVVKPWKDYIASGDRFDWTDKLDVSKDITLKPIFFEQSQIIEFNDLRDEDHMNKPFQDEYSRVYGSLQFDSQSDMLASTRKIETVFAPTPVNLIEGATLATSEFVIPFFSKLGDELTSHGHLQHIPMKPKMRLLFWNGIAESEETWYYTDGTTTYNSSQAPLNAVYANGYPRMTPYSEFPTTANTLNLNWFREIPLFPNGEALLGESVYERYWNQYIQELYSPLARIFTGYFNLDSNDLRTLSFDDIIFIQNAYYRVLKVYDAPITDIQTVKVDLVKILDTVTFTNNGNPNPSGGGIDNIVVVGGGGGPAGDNNDIWGDNNNNFGDNNGQSWGHNYYYTASDCDATLPNITVKSNSPLSIGVVVNVSGISYAGTCWTITDYSTSPEDTTVLDVFASCAECGS